MQKEYKTYFALLVFSLVLVMLPTSLSATPKVSAAAVPPTIPRGEIFQHARTETGPMASLCPFNPATPGAYLGPYESCAYMDTLTGAMKPWLATSWGWVDNYTFYIKMNPLAHWSDGSPLTADDVVFSFGAATNPLYGGAADPIVANYTVHDTYTVWILLKQAYPRNARVLNYLITGSNQGNIWPKKRWAPLLAQYGAHITSFTDLADLTQIVTSCAYLPYYNGPDRYIAKRDDNYWGKALGWFPLPEYYEDYYYGSNEAVVRAAYEGHGGDFSGVGFNEPAWYKANSAYMSCWDITAAAPGMFFHEPSCLSIGPNYNYSVTDSKTGATIYPLRYQWLRQALAQCCNATASLVAGWNMCGNYYPPTFLNPDLSNYDLYFNETALTSTYETTMEGGRLCVAYDPAKAISILQQYCDGSVSTGWTIKGTNVKLGSPTWTIQSVNGWTDVCIECKTFADDWSAIGIPTIAVYPDFGTWMANYPSGNYIWTLIWSRIHLSETANPIADTFYDNLVFEPSALNIWAGSPGSYPLFFDGKHAPLPNTADLVKSLTLSLFQLDPTSTQFINIVKQLQSILVPQCVVIMPHGKSSTQAFVTDRWVNYPTAQNPYEHRLDSVNPAVPLIVKHIEPRCITTSSFSLSAGTVETGTAVTASVTLVNSASYAQAYRVEIREGVACADSQETHPLVAFSIVTVPASGSIVVPLTFTINATGTHTLTVDDWRFNEADTQHVPGVPLEVQLTVTPVSPWTVKAAIDAANAATAAANAAKASADAATAAANSAVTAANNAAPVWMVWASAIITIVVVLVGEYVFTKSIKAQAK
jgi:ABC-type transport system substrate-binding protein